MPRVPYILCSTFLLLVLYPTRANSIDSRCNCKCPEVYWVDETIVTDYPGRKVYINSTVQAVNCDCEHVVQPFLNLTEEQVEKLCPRCQCKHEERSTTTILVVVVIILLLLGVLVLYLLYLVCLDPLLKGEPVQVLRGGGGGAPYLQQEDEPPSLDNDSTPMSAYRSTGVVQRIGREQNKWKKQVEIQRSSVYDRHSMLN